MLEPFAVSITEAARLQGKDQNSRSKGRSTIYQQIERGELEAIKDGFRTLITLRSIKKRMKSLPKFESPGKPCAPHAKAKARA